MDAPDFAGVELGLAERLAARAVAQAAGVPIERAMAGLRDTGDLGLAAEQLLGELDPDRPATLKVGMVSTVCTRWPGPRGKGRGAASWLG